MKMLFLMTIVYLGIYIQIEESFQSDVYVLVFMDSQTGKFNSKEKPLRIIVGTAFPTDVARVCVATPLLDKEKAIKVTHFNVTKTEGTILQFESTYKLTGNGLQKETFIVESDNPVTVVGSHQQKPSVDNFLVLSKSSLGRNYFAVTHAFKGSQCFVACQIAVTAITVGTVINVTLHHEFSTNVVIDGKNYSSGDTINLKLKEFETFEIQSRSDLTGTHIHSNLPIAVFSGNKKTNFRTNSQDHLVEQLIPVESLGRSFIAIPTPNQMAQKTTYFKVIATENNTIYSVNGKQSPILYGSGDWREHEEQYEKYFHITSTKPILVVSMLFFMASYPPTDPCLTVLISEDQWLPSYSYIATSKYTNYFIVIIKDHAKNGLLLNDKPVNNGTWFGVNGTDMVGGYIYMVNGTNYLTHTSSNLTFGAYAFGYRYIETYCSPAGVNLNPANGVVRSPTSSSKEGKFHSTWCLKSTDEIFTHSTLLSETMESSYKSTWYSSVIMPSYSDQSSTYESFPPNEVSSTPVVFTLSTSETWEVSTTGLASTNSPMFNAVNEPKSYSLHLSSSSFFALSSMQAASVRRYALCPCPCHQYSANVTNQSEVIASIQKELMIDKYKVASVVRKKISIKDNRASSSAMGIVGVVFILSSLAMLISMDIPKIMHDFRYIRNDVF